MYIHYTPILLVSKTTVNKSKRKLNGVKRLFDFLFFLWLFKQ